jgi:uncharacterized protein with predicted RNA binding PUA domain
MSEDRALLRRVADYQFGSGAGRVLFPDGQELTVTRTSSGRPRQVLAEEGRLVTYGTDGRFRLGLAGGHRLQSGLSAPAYRVVVGSESEPYVREGRNVFAKFVKRADEAVRPRDEVLVEHADGALLAVGRAELSGAGMGDFETGMAVTVREGSG